MNDLYNMYMRAVLWVIALPPLLLGCRAKTASHPVMPVARNQAVSSTFVSEQFAVELAIPSQWASKHSADYILLLTPQEPGGSGMSISLEVPDLPMHIPGLIPIGLVKNGYVDDLRKQHPDLQVQEQTPPKIAHAEMRLVECTWTDGGQTQHETALLIVHGDHVYILRVEAANKDYAHARAVFDAVAQSIHWNK